MTSGIDHHCSQAGGRYGTGDSGTHPVDLRVGGEPVVQEDCVTGPHLVERDPHAVEGSEALHSASRLRKSACAPLDQLWPLACSAAGPLTTTYDVVVWATWPVPASARTPP